MKTTQDNTITLIIGGFVFLAALIIGSWLNLQRQFDDLQTNVNQLRQSYSQLDKKLEILNK